MDGFDPMNSLCNLYKMSWRHWLHTKMRTGDLYRFFAHNNLTCKAKNQSCTGISITADFLYNFLLSVRQN